MADGSTIEWTDATWNPVRGCSRISPGCGGPNHQGGCYAEKIAARFSDPGQPFHGFAERSAHGGRWTGKLALVPEALTLPFSWRKPRRVFVNSMSDLFHEALPDRAIDSVFAVMAATGRHTYQILTKRADRMRRYMGAVTLDRIEAAAREIGRTLRYEGLWLVDWPLPNVWLGVSVEDQERADERIPDLLATQAQIRFLSCEPLLGPVELWRHDEDADALRGCGIVRSGGVTASTPHDPPEGYDDSYPGIDWVICGGESGGSARPMHSDWARSLRDQCAAAEVPFFFKQWGEWAPGELVPDQRRYPTKQWFDDGWSDCSDDWIAEADYGPIMYRIGKKTAGRLLDGQEHNEFPAERVPA